MTETIQEPKEKIIIEFQHTDENGNPIIDPRTGKQGFTNLVADTQEEMTGKMKDAYLNVTRALARARNHKPVPKESPAAAATLTPEEERLAVADLQDPIKARAAGRKLFGVDQLEEDRKVLKEKQDLADANRAIYQFLARHPNPNDFYPCKANETLMLSYITAENLDPRIVDNYEIAFNAVQGQLAQRPAPPAPEPEPEPQKRQAAGGIQPGSLSGTRTMPKKKELVTKQQIAEWRKTPEGRAEYKKRLRDPAFVSAVNALFAPQT